MSPTKQLHLTLLQILAIVSWTLLVVSGCASVTQLECDLECGAHEECAISDVGLECECVPGYEGDPCSWGGGVRDPEFVESEAWLSTNGAAILPLQEGPDSVGIASFSASAICSAGSISQVVEMPTFGSAEPFVIEVRFRNSLTNVDVGYNRAFATLETEEKEFPRWNVDRVCLGEAGYGGPVKFQVGAAAPNSECFIAPRGVFDIDYFRIVPAHPNECPAPGAITNGDARSSGLPWTTDLLTSSGPSIEFSMEPGIGEGGSDAARLRRPLGSLGISTMRTSVSVPLPNDEMPSPGLRFWWRATDDWQVRVGLGEYQSAGSTRGYRDFDSLIGDGEARIAEYCLPPWTFGGVSELSFELAAGPFDTPAELIVDNVEFFSDARCGTSTDLVDPGFESVPFRWPGTAVFIPGSFESLDRGTRVRLLNDPDRAHSGAGLLQVLQGDSWSTVVATNWVWIAPAEAGRGPELAFRSLLPADLPNDPPIWRVGQFANTLDVECDNSTDPACFSRLLAQGLEPGGGWRSNFICLPNDWAERWVRVGVGFSRRTREPQRTYDPPRELLLDDFQLRLSERCAPVDP